MTTNQDHTSDPVAHLKMIAFGLTMLAVGHLAQRIRGRGIGDEAPS